MARSVKISELPAATIIRPEDIYPIVQSGVTRQAGVFGPGRNLIDNADFRAGCVVNQRGQTSYSGNGTYLIDRWLVDNNGTVALADNGLNLSKASGENYTLIRQSILATDAAKLHGKTMTLSVETDGGIYTNTGVFDFTSEVPLPRKSIPDGALDIMSMAPGGGGDAMVRVIHYAASTRLISRVKLELGPVSTLALDPPADYGETLRKCKQYLLMGELITSQIYSISADRIDFLIPIAEPMRAIPTLILSESAPQTILLKSNSSIVSGFEFSVYNAVVNALHIVCIKTAHGLTNANNLTLAVRAKSGFSAEL